MRDAHHPKSRAFFGALFAVTATLASMAVVHGCADPEGDYNDFVARTNGIRGVVPSSASTAQQDGGSTCSSTQAGAPPDYSATGVPDFSGTYFAECLVRIAVCDLGSTLRYKGVVVKNADGTYTYTYTSLLIGGDNVAPPNPVGASFTVQNSVGADGTFTQAFVNVLTPGAANAFSGNDLTVNTTFTGYVTSDSSYCAELDGKVTVLGADIDLNGPGDICLFKKVSPDTENVNFVLSDFHCP